MTAAYGSLFRSAVALVLIGLLLGALAHPREELAESSGHHGGPITGLRLVGSLPLEAPNADVAHHRGHAYVGTWAGACPGSGVKVVDVRDPAQPSLVATLAMAPNTSAEDVMVIAARTPRFDGDLLAVGLQPCTPDGKAGVEFWDVTDPAAPRWMSYFFIAPSGVHELDLVQRASDGRVLALLAVPYAEPLGVGGEFRIVDATDPWNPTLASDWGITRERGSPPGAGTGAMPVNYAHSALASREGDRAYVSYWDAGVQILDISDPHRPRFLGNTSYVPGAEGNAHSVAVAPEAGLLFQADEDFDARTIQVRVTEPVELAGDHPAVEALFGPRINATVAANGSLVRVGLACGNETLPDVTGRIAFADRGECLFSEKAVRLQDAGAIAMIVSNNIPGPSLQMAGDGENVTIPSLMVDAATGARFNETLANASVAVEISAATVVYNDWGGLRIVDISDPGRPQEVGHYLTPHARNAPPVDDEGRYSVHNPVWLADDQAIVASWFGDGVRVLSLASPGAPVEVASWVPEAIPADPTHGTAELPANVWGVAVAGDLVFASDMERGLFVLELVREIDAASAAAFHR